MWPARVEEMAAVFRAAGVEARLEELPEDETAFPGERVRAIGVDCDGRLVVALVPSDRAVDGRKLARAAGCSFPRPVSTPPFPFRGAARVVLEQSVIGGQTVWLDAGSPRHAVALSPVLLARLVRAELADLVQDP